MKIYKLTWTNIRKNKSTNDIDKIERLNEYYSKKAFLQYPNYYIKDIIFYKKLKDAKKSVQK
jgi:hypothetical protein